MDYFSDIKKDWVPGWGDVPNIDCLTLLAKQ